MKTKDQKSSLKSKTLRLYPNKTQREIFDDWFSIFRWFYNKTIDYCEEHKNYNFRNVRNNLRVNKKYPIPDWYEKEVCPRIISGAISDCTKAYKTGFSQVKSGMINKFNLNYKTKKDKSQTLYLEKSCFTKEDKRLLPTFNIGKIRGIYNKEIKLEEISIEKDCRLSYENGKYYLHIPIDETNGNENQVFGGLISLDSGVRTFQTGYSPSYHTVEIGKNTYEKLKPYLQKIDSLNTLASNRGGCRKKKLFKKMKRIYWRIKNVIDDLHWKTIKFLITNYQTIVISDFRAAEILKRKELPKQSKRILQCLRHYVFRERLKYKVRLNNNELYCVDESYTSKTCTNCGKLNKKLGSNKEFKCRKCKIIIDRDVSGGRNQLIKNWDEVNGTELQVP